jgi:hypothetical protein
MTKNYYAAWNKFARSETTTAMILQRSRRIKPLVSRRWPGKNVGLRREYPRNLSVHRAGRDAVLPRDASAGRAAGFHCPNRVELKVKEE